LEKLQLVRGLRRVPEEKILLSQLAEARRRARPASRARKPALSVRYRELLQASRAKLHHLSEQWTALKAEYAEKTDIQIAHARQALAEMRRKCSTRWTCSSSPASPLELEAGRRVAEIVRFWLIRFQLIQKLGNGERSLAFWLLN